MRDQPHASEHSEGPGLEALCRTILKPIIGILVRGGLPFASFAAIARSVYVEVASEEFGIGGRPTNTSRIAMLTGLSRTQVKKERDLLDAPADTPSTAPTEASGGDKVRHVSRVLMAWHTDQRFVDEYGQPRRLPETGSDSFETLYEDYSGKVVPLTTMLKELRQIGAIVDENGRLRVTTRSYTPSQTDPAGLKRVCMAIGDLATTALYNLFRQPAERSRFERFATNTLVPADQVSAFRDYLETEGQRFLERADDWLSSREGTGNPGTHVRVGVGVYQICPRESALDKKNKGKNPG